MKTITILGSTGSIGMNTLDVLPRAQENYSIYALTANKNWQKLAEQCLQWQPKYAVCVDEQAAEQLQHYLISNACNTEVLAGAQALAQVSQANEVQVVMAAIVGSAGLLPTLAAVETGKRVLLANKEALVMAGSLFMTAAANYNADILPIDSEHNAIFQVMPAHYQIGTRAQQVEKIILTASGGPFRQKAIEELSKVTLAQACAHPVWSMGRKISIDSATMMNKGLEVIEAHYLFAMPISAIEVVIHPQSIIHSFVAYEDGSLLALMACPDMRIPISHALNFPQRSSSGADKLDITNLQQLTFSPVNYHRYPCLRLAYEACAIGGMMPNILNAANEVAVAEFIVGNITFIDIAKVNEQVMLAMKHDATAGSDLTKILAAAKQAHDIAKSVCCYL